MVPNPRIFNQLLGALSIDDTERIINIKENSTADTNFILAHLLKQILQEQNRICFITLHNDIEHYQTVSKKLGYDISSPANANRIKIVKPIDSLFEHIGESTFSEKVDYLSQHLYSVINESLDTLSTNFEGVIYIVIDDVSHLLDVGIYLRNILSFLNYCVNLVSDRVKLIINSHVCCSKDTVISNYMNYVSDVSVEVLPLNTGKSVDVSGVLSVQRFKNNNTNRTSQFHFKVFDRGIKVFSMGETVYSLLK